MKIVGGAGGFVGRRFFVIVRVGFRECVAHALPAMPAMVLFFLFPFLPLLFAFTLTAVAVLFKPGCAISAADTSSV